MITCQFEDGNKVFLRHVTVDVLVLQDDKILLMKHNKKLLEGGKWGLTGGYMDRDETLQQAGRREVVEESGWEVGELTLLTINDELEQPNEDRQNIKFIYFADAIKKIGEADWESDEIRWFPLDELPEVMAFDHRSNIELYKKYRHEGLTLPTLPT